MNKIESITHGKIEETFFDAILEFMNEIYDRQPAGRSKCWNSTGLPMSFFIRKKHTRVIQVDFYLQDKGETLFQNDFDEPTLENGFFQSGRFILQLSEDDHSKGVTVLLEDFVNQGWTTFSDLAHWEITVKSLHGRTQELLDIIDKWFESGVVK